MTKNWWLKTTDIYSVIILEAGSPKSRYQGVIIPLDAREEPFLASL